MKKTELRTEMKKQLEEWGWKEELDPEIEKKLEEIADPKLAELMKDPYHRAIAYRLEQEPHNANEIIEILNTWGEGIGTRQFVFSYFDDNDVYFEPHHGTVTNLSEDSEVLWSPLVSEILEHLEDRMGGAALREAIKGYFN